MYGMEEFTSTEDDLKRYPQEIKSLALPTKPSKHLKASLVLIMANDLMVVNTPTQIFLPNNG